MRIGIVAFTENGSRIALRLVSGLAALGHEPSGFTAERRRPEQRRSVQRRPERLRPGGTGDERSELHRLAEPLRDWTGRFFEPGCGLIFVGAAGIAVRSVAPFLRGKDRDPAVVVVDERGNYAVSLLSGHLGGANELACLVSSVLGAEPVITTATDLNGVFAVDLFAKANDLVITDFTAAKEISSELLRGGEVGFFSEFPVDGELPSGLAPGKWRRRNIWISVRRDAGLPGADSGSGEGREEIDAPACLLLVPRAVAIGVGCRRGAGEEEIAGAVRGAMEAGNLHPLSAVRVASIDLKKDEEGLLLFAKERKLPLFFYSAAELERAAGEFSESEFVRRTAGVGNVCERAAVLSCLPHPGRLAVGKTVSGGVTAAAAVEERRLCFPCSAGTKP